MNINTITVGGIMSRLWHVLARVLQHTTVEKARYPVLRKLFQVWNTVKLLCVVVALAIGEVDFYWLAAGLMDG